MPHLIIEQPTQPAMRVELMKAVTSLGRSEDNDVVLVADEVSRHHAEIRRRGDRLLLVDLKSMNGTYVNRQRIVERLLAPGDEIWFGSKCRIQYDEEPRSEPSDESGSTLNEDLERIRADMDRLGDSMTLIARRADADPQAAATGIADAFDGDLVAVGRAYRRLVALHRASNQTSRLIASNATLQERLASVLDTAVEALGAERGFVMLRDEDSDALQIHVARAMGAEAQAGSPSAGIAGRAAMTGEPVLMRDREQDEQFSARESIIAQQIHSAMCVPLRVEDRILGSIYVDSRRVGHSFTEEDLEMFASMAAQSALAIENVRLYEQTVQDEKKRANLGRFLSPDVVSVIMDEGSDITLGGRKQVATTLFCDIRGFTPIAERMPPAALVGLVNEHFTAMVEIVFSLQGTLDKFIGDEVMAVFGAPLSRPDDAARAVRAAVRMLQRNAELNAVRTAEGRPPLELGIGINTGEVIAGCVGSPERMEFTVVGDEVNVARRFCSLAEPGQILFGASTYEQVRDVVDVRDIGPVPLKGKERPLQAYQVVGLRGEG